MRLVLFVFLTLVLTGQETPMTAAEKLFQESMANVTLTGFYTNGNSGELKQDRYVIEKISKAGGNVWKFDVRIQYNGKDMAIALPVPILWAGETPVVTLTNMPIPGSGTFTARVLFHNGEYVGTWAGADGRGGKMFGTIGKNAAAKP